MTNALAWTPPIGHPDIAPSRFERIEGGGYLTLDAPWIVPALLRSVPIEGRVLEPAAGRGHLSFELRRAGLEVTSFDHRRYADPLVPDIEEGDIRRLTTLEGFAWVVTNLPYEALEELATHLLDLSVRDHCAVALLLRAEWLVPKARDRLVHGHPHFAGAVTLTARPRWVAPAQDNTSPRHKKKSASEMIDEVAYLRRLILARCPEISTGDLEALIGPPRHKKKSASPRHNFAWGVWGATPRVGDPWLRLAGRFGSNPRSVAHD